jgi:Zn-finger nucleic acid-binding protein
MLLGQLNQTRLHECPKCFGIWLDTMMFERVCRSAEREASLLGAAQPLPTAGLAPVRYVPCPECRQLMHRVNFARCSGVIVDVCRPHGTWFDRHELHRIVAFIRAGGLDESRNREKAELQRERRRLETARQQTEPVVMASVGPESLGPAPVEIGGDLLSEVITAASDIWFSWFSH